MYDPSCGGCKKHLLCLSMLPVDSVPSIHDITSHHPLMWFLICVVIFNWASNATEFSNTCRSTGQWRYSRLQHGRNERLCRYTCRLLFVLSSTRILLMPFWSYFNIEHIATDQNTLTTDNQIGSVPVVIFYCHSLRNHFTCSRNLTSIEQIVVLNWLYWCTMHLNKQVAFLEAC